jgi:hypothetical protein
LKYKLLVILHYLILIGVVAFFGNFYPQLDSMPIDSVQQGAIRFLASLLYFGDLDAWIRLLLFYAFATLIIGIGCALKSFDGFNEYAKIIIFIQALLWFFYWQFCVKYAPEFYQVISQKILLSCLLQIGMITGIILVIWIGIKIRIRIKRNNPITLPQIVRFQCPYCLRIYTSSVSFCLKCQQTIEPIILPPPKEE